MPWPHQVWLGDNCRLEPGIYFKFDWYWKTGPSIIVGDRVFIGRAVEFNIQGRIEIGNDCLIASGCIFVDHDHGMDLRQPMRSQPQESHPILIRPNVWIGANAVILKGVEISEGAVIGAGSIVTKSIPPNEIWCGNPAKKMGLRN
jgi:acetyltransferase-like isoleucine patch superfamily enzyme